MPATFFAVCLVLFSRNTLVDAVPVNYTPSNTCKFRRIANETEPMQRLNVFDIDYAVFGNAFKEGVLGVCLYGKNCGSCCDMIGSPIDDLDEACYQHDICLHEAGQYSANIPFIFLLRTTYIHMIVSLLHLCAM